MWFNFFMKKANAGPLPVTVLPMTEDIAGTDNGANLEGG